MRAAELYRRYKDELEDFWGRRQNAPAVQRKIELFGRSLEISSNDPLALEAVDFCRPLYSTAPSVRARPGVVQLVVDPGTVRPDPVPDDLVRRVRYVGHGSWVILQAGTWGTAFVDLEAQIARVVLTPELAQRPDLVSACLLNTVFLNLFIGSGMGMLHASCLLRDGRAILLMGPHNSGKSTTALRLARSGYRLFSDSMVFVARCGEDLQFLGFPVGRVRLRGDAVGNFPELKALLEEEQVRDETKYSVDLRACDADMVQEKAVIPGRVELCLLERGERRESRLQPASRETVLKAVFVNSLYFDREEIWQRNLELLEEIVDRARCHHLTIGSWPEKIVERVDSLWEEGAG